MPSLLILCVYEKVDSRPTHSYFCFHFHLGDLKFSQFHAVFWKIWQKRMLAPTGRLAPPPTGDPWSSTVLVFSFNRKQKNLTPFFGILVVIRPFVHFIYFIFPKLCQKHKKHIFLSMKFVSQSDQTKLSPNHASEFDCDWQPLIATHWLLFVSIRHLNVLITAHVPTMVISYAPRSNLGSEDRDMTRLGDRSC